jgi:uncharacterized cysteine cluster protein YcgN (CxxCxxCC family)
MITVRKHEEWEIRCDACGVQLAADLPNEEAVAAQVKRMQAEQIDKQVFCRQCIARANKVNDARGLQPFYKHDDTQPQHEHELAEQPA